MCLIVLEEPAPPPLDIGGGWFRIRGFVSFAEVLAQQVDDAGEVVRVPVRDHDGVELERAVVVLQFGDGALEWGFCAGLHAAVNEDGGVADDDGVGGRPGALENVDGGVPSGNVDVVGCDSERGGHGGGHGGYGVRITGGAGVLFVFTELGSWAIMDKVEMNCFSEFQPQRDIQKYPVHVDWAGRNDCGGGGSIPNPNPLL